MPAAPQGAAHKKTRCHQRVFLCLIATAPASGATEIRRYRDYSIDLVLQKAASCGQLPESFHAAALRPCEPCLPAQRATTLPDPHPHSSRKRPIDELPTKSRLSDESLRRLFSVSAQKSLSPASCDQVRAARSFMENSRSAPMPLSSARWHQACRSEVSCSRDAVVVSHI